MSPAKRSFTPQEKISILKEHLLKNNLSLHSARNTASPKVHYMDGGRSYSGLEMAALKWHNVDTDRCTVRICETLVYGIEGRPKT